MDWEVVEKLRVFGFETTYPKEVKSEDLKSTINKVLNDVSNFILEKFGYHYYYPKEYLPHKDKEFYNLPKDIE